MSDKFRTWMNAVEDDLLEEAMAPVKRRNIPNKRLPKNVCWRAYPPAKASERPDHRYS